MTLPASRLSSFRKVAVAYVQAFVHLILLHSIDTVGDCGGGVDDRDRFQQILELYLKLPNAYTRYALCNRKLRRQKCALD